MSLLRIMLYCEPLKNRDCGFSHLVVPLVVRRSIRRAGYLATIADYVRQDILHHAALLGYPPSTPLRYARCWLPAWRGNR